MATRTQAHVKRASKDWPFNIVLIPKGKLTVDLRYQRPPQAKFVDKLIAEFDETRVGVLDVAERSDGTYAILDGAQRFEAIKKHKRDAWCAVYTGMTLAGEAQFFYDKNRNRRNVHAFYAFRALMVTGNKKALDINRIVESEGYKLEVGAAPDHHISAIRAVEDCYGFSSLTRKECLSDTLHLMREAFFGRQGGKEGTLIRGIGWFFRSFDKGDIDYDWLLDKMVNQHPQVLIHRSDDYAATNRQPAYYHMARDIVNIYNRNRNRGKLSLRFVETTNK